MDSSIVFPLRLRANMILCPFFAAARADLSVTVSDRGLRVSSRLFTVMVSDCGGLSPLPELSEEHAANNDIDKINMVIEIKQFRIII
jgi:hypothetical protein